MSLVCAYEKVVGMIELGEIFIFGLYLVKCPSFKNAITCLVALTISSLKVLKVRFRVQNLLKNNIWRRTL